jgi:hypothetical protein
VREQTIEQPLRLLITTLQYVVVDEPKTAEQKCSFAGWQAINGIFSFVPQNELIGVDTSLLLLPLVGFLPATDPRIRGTLQAIEQRLLANVLDCAWRNREPNWAWDL